MLARPTSLRRKKQSDEECGEEWERLQAADLTDDQPAAQNTMGAEVSGSLGRTPSRPAAPGLAGGARFPHAHARRLRSLPPTPVPPHLHRSCTQRAASAPAVVSSGALMESCVQSRWRPVRQSKQRAPGQEKRRPGLRRENERG